jgi:DNA-binding NarL/FixJ family response regulator
MEQPVPPALERPDHADDAIRLLIVDDHGLFRYGLREGLMLSDERIVVVAEAGNATEGARLAAELAPDVALMDLHMPGMVGVDGLREMARCAPAVRVLVLSGSAEDGDVVDAIVAGAYGYIVKGADIAEIVAGVHAAAAGESVLSPAIAGHLLERVRADDEHRQIPAELASMLTPRELEVLRLIAEGKDNSDIADVLVISPRTAKNHVASILHKLQIDNRIQAAVLAVKHGIA